MQREAFHFFETDAYLKIGFASDGLRHGENKRLDTAIRSLARTDYKELVSFQE
jgi:hypothetical protein